MELWLIRHGKTQGNIEKRYSGGGSDEIIADEGKLDLLKYIENNIYKDLDMIYTSPMIRCIQTTEILFPNKNYKVIEEFREMNFGDFEGLTHNEITSIEGNEDFGLVEANMIFPKGETFEELNNRCINAIKKIIEIGKDCVVVCHGGVIMSILNYLSNEKKGFYDWYCENGLGYVIELKDKNINKITNIRENFDLFT